MFTSQFPIIKPPAGTRDLIDDPLRRIRIVFFLKQLQVQASGDLDVVTGKQVVGQSQSVHGLLGDESAELLRTFFRRRRSKQA